MNFKSAALLHNSKVFLVEMRGGGSNPCRTGRGSSSFPLIHICHHCWRRGRAVSLAEARFRGSPRWWRSLPSPCFTKCPSREPSKCFFCAGCLQQCFAPPLFIFTLNCTADGAADSRNQRVPSQPRQLRVFSDRG